MAYTFATLYAEVGNLTPSTAVARDKAFINEAVHRINSERKWSWLESTTTFALVASQRTYVLLGTSPIVQDFDSMISLTMELTASGARVKLPEAPPQLFEQITAHVFTNSQPMLWTIQGGAASSTSGATIQGGQQLLTVSPPPLATAGNGVNLIARYWRSAAGVELSADADIPIIPAQYAGMIIDCACSLAMGRYLLATDAAVFEQKYQARLQSAVQADIAMRRGDNETLAIAAVPQLPNQVPQTQATFDPSRRPYPVAS